MMASISRLNPAALNERYGESRAEKIGSLVSGMATLSSVMVEHYREVPGEFIRRGVAPIPRQTMATASRRTRRPTKKHLPKPVVEEIFRRFAARDPEPRGELDHKDPFTLLVAVVLSAQATDSGVNKATPRLFALADTPAKMAALDEERVADAIRTIGLYRNKAKNVVALAKALMAQHGGAVPRSREALEALPGVGRKTANVVLNIAFGEPTIAVDTHIFRVANRTGLAPGKTPLQVEQKLLRVVPKAYLKDAHHWLILHGRYTCKARKPACPECIVRDLCSFKSKVTM
jgi:endonuclease-3